MQINAGRRPLEVPPPASRISTGLYIELRAWMVDNDADALPMLTWANELKRPPATPEELAAEVIWIILCAGRSAQAARTLERRVWSALDAGTPVVEAYGYRAKASAIERAWHERQFDFGRMVQALAAGDLLGQLAWARSIPFIGDDTAFQLLKNCGVSTHPKPDIWLCRLAGIPDRPRKSVEHRFPPCLALCEPLAAASGDTVAAVDTLLWLSCNKGILTVDASAGPVSFRPRRITARPITPFSRTVAEA